MKKHMNRFWALLLTAVLTFSLAAPAGAAGTEALPSEKSQENYEEAFEDAAGNDAKNSEETSSGENQSGLEDPTEEEPVEDGITGEDSAEKSIESEIDNSSTEIAVEESSEDISAEISEDTFQADDEITPAAEGEPVVLAQELPYSNDCSTATDETKHTKVVTPTGNTDWTSSYYKLDENNADTNDPTLFAVDFSNAKLASFLNVEFDLRFDAADGEFMLKDVGSKLSGGNPCILASISSENKLQIQKSSSSYTTSDVGVELNTWYHVNIRGFCLGDQTAENSAYYMTLQKYVDGSLGDTTMSFQADGPFIARSNKVKPNRLVFKNVSVDNISISEVPVASVTLSAAENADSISAGSTLQFTATALTEKNEDMTKTATVTYSVSGVTGVSINESTGLLTASESAASGTATVMASAGDVTSSAVTITVTGSGGGGDEPDPPTPGGDVQEEPTDPFDKNGGDYLINGLYYFDNCSEDNRTGATLVKDAASPNKTPYYTAADGSTVLDFIFNSKGASGFHVWQADVRFNQAGAGFVLKNRTGTSGDLDTDVICDNNQLAVVKDSKSNTICTDESGKNITLDANTWYQITLRGYYVAKGSTEGQIDLYIQAYDESGNLTGTATRIANVNKRNNVPPTRLVVHPGTSIDNVRVYEVAPGSVTLAVQENAATTITAGGSVQLVATAKTTKDEIMPASVVTYEISSSSQTTYASVDSSGLLTTSVSDPAQTLTITAKAGTNTSSPVTITVTANSDAPVLKDEPTDPFNKTDGDYLKNGLYYFDNCSTDNRTGATLMKDAASPNRTPYYKAADSGVLDFVFNANGASGFHVWQADIRFDTDKSGFILKNKTGADGNLDTDVFRNGSTVTVDRQASDNPVSFTIEDASTWYQVTLRGTYGIDDGQVDLYIQPYGSDGQLTGQPTVFKNVQRRNNKAPTRIVVHPGTSVDNVRVYEAAPSKVVLLDGETELTGVLALNANSTKQFGVKLYTTKNELMPSGTGAVKYEVYSGDKKYTGSDISISAEGLLTIRGNAQTQTVTVRATSKSARTVYGQCTVNVTAVSGIEAMLLQKVGFDSLTTPTRLVNVTGILNYAPEEDLVFIAAIYDSQGVLKTRFVREVSIDDLGTDAALTINFNGVLPSDFNKDSDTIKVYTWTRR